MKETYSYKECYTILGIQPDCNWKALRRAYKKSIQKWHPDRFKDDSKEKTVAEDKIKIINIAYTRINQYYRDNNKLPSVNDNIVNNKAPTAPPPSETKHVTSKSGLPKRTTAQNKAIKTTKFPIFTSVILLTLFVSFYIIFQSDTEHSNSSYYEKIESYFYEEPQNIQIKSRKRQKVSALHTTYFTIGSSLGDVISAQGTPTRTEGNIWFYGDSEVHFTKGVVTHWVRSSRTPLKIQLKNKYNQPIHP